MSLHRTITPVTNPVPPVTVTLPPRAWSTYHYSIVLLTEFAQKWTLTAGAEKAALDLVRNLNLEGCCEVEFRRDAAGRPLLMEINARLSGSIEVSVRSGVPFPTLLWQWAAGEHLTPVPGYRPGIKMRYLKGDMKWLWENIERRGLQPDGVPPQTAIATFAKDFMHRQSYDYLDRQDLRPAIAALAANVNLARRKFTHGSDRSAERTKPEIDAKGA